MTPWRWWWLEEAGDNDGGWCGDCSTREEAITDAQRNISFGEKFEVMEARSSTSMEYEGADCVPFLRTRNRETLFHGLEVIT